MKVYLKIKKKFNDIKTVKSFVFFLILNLYFILDQTLKERQYKYQNIKSEKYLIEIQVIFFF